MSKKEKQLPIDYRIGIDYEKIRRIIREELDKAIRDWIKVIAETAEEIMKNP